MPSRENPSVPDVQTCWQQLRSQVSSAYDDPARCALEALPVRFRTPVISHMELRRQQNNGLPLLGEMVPAIVADLVGHPEAIFDRDALVGWYQIYYSIILADDLIDESRSPSYLRLFLACMLLQQKGVLLVAPYLHKTSIISRIFIEMAESADDESRYGSLADLGKKSVARRIAKEKLAVVELLLALVPPSFVSPKTKVISQCLSSFTTLIQFLDDITDLPKDINSHHNTFLTAQIDHNLSVNDVFFEKAYRKGIQVALSESQKVLRLLKMLRIRKVCDTDALATSIQRSLQDLLDVLTAMESASVSHKSHLRTRFYRRLSTISAAS